MRATVPFVSEFGRLRLHGNFVRCMIHPQAFGQDMTQTSMSVAMQIRAASKASMQVHMQFDRIRFAAKLLISFCHHSE